MRRHAIVRVAVTSALTLALAAAPLHGASAAPVAGATKKPVPPPADTTAPTDPATPPADTATPPTDTTTPPTDTTTPPADGTTPPADGTTPPADGTTPPADGTTPTEPPPEEPKPADTPKAEPAPAPTPAVDPNADRPEEPRVAGKPRTGKGLMIAGGTVLGVGIAATITFGLMTRHCSYDGPLSCKLKDQDQLLIPLGAAATLAGAMLLAVGIGYHVHYKKWERWKPGDNEKKKRRGRGSKTAFVPSVMPGGGGMVWAGRF